jgi:hypothetical protein
VRSGQKGGVSVGFTSVNGVEMEVSLFLYKKLMEV